ncbi:C4-dicarboxylate ABC transporter substrate-binding protein [Siminovitchia terrae]|uniref:C4-dicarboxylate ABC transporter substrate-binding protein n=1 Tax=Siminovitchia terrae TaxID=1914933 RepID=A0ABQ4KWK6_SIMTE|nr:TRAP transporter large permease subunit [Siminovitchia terrae]GIN91587.1 C4-dicarboxylate ABC transporter substrate-binding protein [Siminovitchia terrae]GIN95677.1 C4-dicarboxylate ABC transporter substrate-binding protein [Siminovitchia terrae]
MLGIPSAILYLIVLIGFVAILFVGLKRPMYEVMTLSFVFIVVITGSYGLFWESLLFPSTSSLFYAIFAFMVVAVIFDVTKVVDKIIQLMLAVVGKFRGGAGYVSILGSTFMASLSGTGPGNVATTGVFTIPMMKRSNFPPALAASVEMSASMLGNIIPPSGIVILSFGILQDVYPDSISLSNWMVAAYGIGAWFFIQRWLTLWALCKIYKVEPVPTNELPKFMASLINGWPALILPLVIFLPLFFDAQYKDFIMGRIGEEGTGAFSSSVLMFTPGLAGAYALAIGRKALPSGKVTITNILNMFKESLIKVVPIGVTIYMAYATSQVFIGLQMDTAVRDWFLSFELNTAAIIIILPLFFMVLGMILPGSAQVAILGGAMIAVFGALGGNPVLLAALLPAMTGALEGMTPPLALGLFVAMGIAGSSFKDTAKLAVIWVIAHVVLSIVLLTGILPIIGL